MVAQILRAKYYPHSSFLEAQLGSKPSFVWRSLFNSRDLLLKGLIWRVGNGQSIRIWEDKWLPTPTTFAVQSSPQILPANAKVADLIDSDLKDWNVGLIKAVFVEEEAKVIINIPLSPCLPNDRLIWMGTKHGGFTVRSAYHLGKELQEREEGQCSKVEKGEEFWKAIWALEVPNMVKLFTWRACNNQTNKSKSVPQKGS
jgi:hypothetical protein